MSCRIQKISEIDLHNENKIGAVRYAPILSCIIIGAVSLIFVILSMLPQKKIWLLFGLGIFCAAMAVFVYRNLEDKPTIDVYETFMILYDPDDITLGRQVMYDDIEEWNVVPNSNSVRFLMKDGKEMFKDTFNGEDVYKYLIQVMPDKEKVEKEKERNRKSKLRFHNPFK